jgi:hypothetical protein
VPELLERVKTVIAKETNTETINSIYIASSPSFAPHLIKFTRYHDVPKETSSASGSHFHPGPGSTSHHHRCVPGPERDITATKRKLGVLDILDAWSVWLHI